MLTNEKLCVKLIELSNEMVTQKNNFWKSCKNSWQTYLKVLKFNSLNLWGDLKFEKWIAKRKGVQEVQPSSRQNLSFLYSKKEETNWAERMLD